MTKFHVLLPTLFTTIAAATCQAGDDSSYGKIVSANFPGFQILSTSEIVANDNQHIAIIEGHFYSETSKDIAALIRSNSVKGSGYKIGEKEVYAGKLIACKVTESKCDVITSMPIYIPYDNHLVFQKRGSIKGCVDDSTEPNRIFKTDGIGGYSSHMDGVDQVYFYDRLKRSFYNCVTSD